MDSLTLVKNLIKTKMQPTRKNLEVGRILMFRYNAKTKAPYDATPFAIILSTSKSYALGINLHWCPIKLRLSLINWIFKRNKQNIKQNKPLSLNYDDLRNVIKSKAYRPIVRLYIIKRMSKQCVKIPYENMEQIAKTKSETFTGTSENTLYRLARKGKK